VLVLYTHYTRGKLRNGNGNNDMGMGMAYCTCIYVKKWCSCIATCSEGWTTNKVYWLTHCEWGVGNGWEWKYFMKTGGMGTIKVISAHL